MADFMQTRNRADQDGADVAAAAGQLQADAANDKDVKSRDWGNTHPVNIRFSVPFVRGGYYVTLVAGIERRNPGRRSQERDKHPLVTVGNGLFMLGAGTVVGLAALALIQIVARFVLEYSGVLGVQ